MFFTCLWFRVNKNSQWKFYYILFTTLLKQKVEYANDWLISCLAICVSLLPGITMLYFIPTCIKWTQFSISSLFTSASFCPWWQHQMAWWVGYVIRNAIRRCYSLNYLMVELHSNDKHQDIANDTFPMFLIFCAMTCAPEIRITNCIPITSVLLYVATETYLKWLKDKTRTRTPWNQLPHG